MGREKVHELVNSVLTAIVLHKQSVEIEHIITDWLEQNQPEPYVELMREALSECEKYLVDRGIEHKGVTGRTIVLPKIREALAGARQLGVYKNMFGWTDDEVRAYASELAGCDEYSLLREIRSMFAAMRRDFDKATAERSVQKPTISQVVELSDEYTGYESDLVARALSELEAKEVVVGLSDEQVSDLAEAVAGIDNVHRVETRIAGYLMTQNLTQPSKFLEDQYHAARRELEQLKSQQFMPEWNDAPDWANWLAHGKYGDWMWFERKPEDAHVDNFHFVLGGRTQRAGMKNWQQSLQQRPKTTPTVEVGQVWECEASDGGKNKVKVIGKNSLQVAYQYSCDDEIRIDTPSDFFADFEQVQL